jgi:hypothetical protein
MNTTAKQLVDHWTWAADKGLMNRNTAAALRTACLHVLGVLDGWEHIDVTSLDVDDAIRRFQHLRAREFNPKSLTSYARRFRRALASFAEYVKDPGGWKPASRGPKSPTESHGQKRHRQPRATAMHDNAEQSVVAASPTRGLIEYPFPLRDDLVARLMLPRDISAAEVKRLSGFMMALAVDRTEQH